MSQLAAMSQAMMNPMMYPYQALAMAQLMGAAGGTGGTTQSSSSSNSKSNGSQSAASQMMEIQRQAAEQLQRQYLLDMIPPGSMGQSWPASNKKWLLHPSVFSEPTQGSKVTMLCSPLTLPILEPGPCTQRGKWCVKQVLFCMINLK